MTQEEIIALAKWCGVTHRTWDYQDERAIESFFHAAQRQAYGRAAALCDALQLPDLYSQPCVDDLAKEIRALIEGDGK